MIKDILDFMNTGTGRAVVRVIAGFFVLITFHFTIMSLAGQFMALEKSAKKKMIVKTFAVLIATVLSLGATILLSYVLYRVNDRRALIAESIVYYMMSAGLYLFLISNRTKDLIKSIKSRKK